MEFRLPGRCSVFWKQSRGPSARLDPTAAILERGIVLADPTIGLSVFHSTNHGSRAASLQSAVRAQESVGVQVSFSFVSNSRDLVSVRQLSSLSARSNLITRGYQVLWMVCADDGLPGVDAAPNSPRWTRDQRREAKAGRCCPAPGQNAAPSRSHRPSTPPCMRFCCLPAFGNPNDCAARGECIIRPQGGGGSARPMCSRQEDFWTEFPCCEGRLPVEQPAWKTCLRAAIWRRSGECHLPDDRSGCPRNTAWSSNKGPSSTNEKNLSAPLSLSGAQNPWIEYMTMCCRALTAAACPRSTSNEAFCVSDPGRPKPQPLESCLPNLY